MPSVLVPLAQGCEELEAVTIIDLLRRAAIDVVTAGLDNRPVTASRGTLLIADTRLDDVIGRTFDMIVLPGGQPGADHLAADPRIIALLAESACRRALHRGDLRRSQGPRRRRVARRAIGDRLPRSGRSRRLSQGQADRRRGRRRLDPRDLARARHGNGLRAATDRASARARIARPGRARIGSKPLTEGRSRRPGFP
jgi:hypothetical protein